MSWLKRKLFRFILLVALGIVLSGFGCIVEGNLSQWAVAQSVASGQLVEQGLRSYQAGKFPEAIALWEQALSQVTQPKERAILHSNLGQAYRQVGKFSEAVAQWEQAIQIYQSDRDATGQKALAQLLTEQAQAYSDLGQHKSAIDRLQRAIQLARKSQDISTETAAQGALGNAYWSLGTYDDALTAHQGSLTLACKLNHSPYITTALNNLGNVFASRSERYRFQAAAANLEGDSLSEEKLTRQANRDSRIALAAYQRSAEVSQTIGGLAEARALLNLNRLLEKTPVDAIAPLPELACPTLNFPALLAVADKPGASTNPTMTGDRQVVIDRNRNQILALLEAEPDSQEKAYSLINLANSLMQKDKGLRLKDEKGNSSPIPHPSSLLEKALAVAKNVGDARAESFALGTLGEMYESRQQYDQAMKLTRQAQFVAQQTGSADSLYRWQWQIGRILKATGQTSQAIAAYQQAIVTLQSIRGDIIIANKDLQFDFRDAVEPVYRQLIGLLLKEQESGVRSQEPEVRSQKSAGKGQKAEEDTGIRGHGDAGTGGRGDTETSIQNSKFKIQNLALKTQNSSNTQHSALSTQHLDSTQNSKLKTQNSLPPPSSSSSNVSRVLDILELLKLAELQNFFGDDCVQIARDTARAEQSLAKTDGNRESAYGLIDSKAAVIYTVVLEDSSYAILRLPDGTLKKYPVLVSADNAGAGTKQVAANTRVSIGSGQLQVKIDALRILLEKRSTEEYLTEAREMYDALIRPMEADLKAANPATLVFINDGVLRKVPMAALHDGQQFLIEKYPIATTPSLSLTTRRPFERNNTKALILGLTLEQAPFAALPNVGAEVEGVQKILGGTELVDQAFTLESMQQRLAKTRYPIIHMATHGKFGADAASTFLLSYRNRITINQLDELLRTRRSQQPVELLTLSACQTAAGDNRSALGIAGIAVRAGVKSALATLWFINDQATVPLIKEFYTQLLQPNTTKAQALRQAQLKLIGDREYNHPAVWSPFILIGNWL
ncbi:CHAT domain-containing protein [Kovacikia minuta CCNUW1]|uniref:CHAT domain-containing protein n=1 Tax=Kovacikia minuta TaxID=2931930 RepID=UPI001CCF284D|nr:CHAT domain-containing protein [Kovacikia minuta]UBF28869.1 CHAT domain-containing protein [Kovacikia minuta CCNUW1]